jgi:hypothetical protein
MSAVLSRAKVAERFKRFATTVSAVRETRMMGLVSLQFTALAPAVSRRTTVLDDLTVQ